MKPESPAAPLIIRGIACELGAESDLGALPEVVENADLGETLRHLGLGCYRSSSGNAIELAERSCRATLQRARVTPGEVDALVFATMSLRTEEASRKSFRRLHASLGLTGAYPVGLFGSECANLPMALQTAADMIVARGLSNVLIVTSDVVGPGRRLMQGMVSIFSDGAASCLLSGRGDGGFALDALSLCCSPDMWDIEPSNNLLAYWKGSMSGAASALGACLEKTGTSRTDYRCLLTGNFNRSVLRTYAAQLGFEAGQMFADNLARVGHSFSADPLINLGEAAASGRLLQGDRCLMLGSGPNTWGAAAIRALAPETA